ncbi:hypothetical protein EC10E094_43230 [Escherichia coli]|nr:hypothetical protein EC10E094_43230 [Escherichia coli]
MISLPSGTRIWLVAGITDMRKSFNGLGEQVRKRKLTAVCSHQTRIGNLDAHLTQTDI